MIGLVAVTSTVGLGGLIVVEGLRRSGGWPGVVLGAVLVVAGAVGFGPLLIAWRIDEAGVRRGRRPLLSWSEVVAVEVRGFRTRRGMGPPHVDVVLRTATRRAQFSVYSRRDAGLLQDALADRLPPGAEGRTRLHLITDAWSAMD